MAGRRGAQRGRRAAGRGSAPSAAGAADRVWGLSVVRVLALAALLGASWAFGESRPRAESAADAPWVPPVVLGYLVATTVAGLLARRRSRSVRAATVGVVVAADAMLLRHALDGIGGDQPVELVLVAYLVAVCLLASWRLGLLASLAQSAAAVVGSAGPLPWSAPPVLPGPDGVPAALADQALVWLVVLTTVAVASLDERERRRRGREAEAAQALARGLHEDTTAGDVAARVLRFAVEDVGCRRAAVVRQHRDGLELVCGHEVARPPHLAQAQASSLLALAASTPGPDLARPPDPLRDPWLAAVLPRAGGLVVARLDVGLERRLWLVADPGGRRRGRRGRQVAAVLARVPGTTALALSRVELLAAAQAAATVDPLTGVSNRRSLDELLASLTERLRRTGRGFAVIMTDVDRFKSVNDSLGHDAGDEVLRRVAEALRSEVRSHEVVARYGGEEFAVVLPDTDRDDAVALAERLRVALHTITEPVRVTASFGVAAVPQDAAEGAGAVSVADAALLRAKRQGRDRVVAAFADRGDGAAAGEPGLPAPRGPSWRSASSGTSA